MRIYNILTILNEAKQLDSAITHALDKVHVIEMTKKKKP